MGNEAVSYLLNWNKWLMIIVIAGSGCRVTYQATRKALAMDDSTIQECNTKIVNTIKASIILVSITGIIEIIKALYT